MTRNWGSPERAVSGHIWIQTAGVERSDRAEVFGGMPTATVRQALRGDSYNSNSAKLWFFDDHDVERLNVYRGNPDGTTDVIAVVKHLRLLDSRTISVVVGRAGNPVIQ